MFGGRSGLNARQPGHTACPSPGRPQCARAGGIGADPALISEAVDRLEQRRIIDLALVRLMAGWNRGALQMADDGQVFLQPMEQIAAHDLHMVEIELDR